MTKHACFLIVYKKRPQKKLLYPQSISFLNSYEKIQTKQYPSQNAETVFQFLENINRHVYRPQLHDELE